MGREFDRGGRGQRGGRGAPRGGRGGRGGPRGGVGARGRPQTRIEPHRHSGIFVAKGKEEFLVTRNMVPGESVYGEKRIDIEVKIFLILLRIMFTFIQFCLLKNKKFFSFKYRIIGLLGLLLIIVYFRI